jgi:DNA repair protein RadC
MEQISEITINYNPRKKLSGLAKITNSKEAEEQFRALWSNKLNHIEEMYLLLLNRANKVLGFSKISQGGCAGTVVDPKVIFQTALKANASSIILAHNHPSGNLKPSEADLKITKSIREAGKFMEILLVDHIILTDEGFYSFADEGII